MTIQDTLQILGLLLSFGTLISIFWTIRVMEKQRKDAQKPELMIPRNIIIFGFKGNGEIASKWLNNYSEVESYKDNNENFYIDIYNIGIGAAKSITIKWKFDFSTVARKIKEYLITYDIHDDFTIENNGLELKVENNLEWIPIDIDDIYLPCVLPVSVIQEKEKFKLPVCLSSIYAFLVYLKFSEGLLDENTFNALNYEPKIEINLSYTDISNAKYSKSFTMEFILKRSKNYFDLSPSLIAELKVIEN